MKIEISELADFLLRWGGLPAALDLDTGELYEIDLEAGELIGTDNKTGKLYAVKYGLDKELSHLRKLPIFSPTPIYQSYLTMAQEKLGIQFGSWFDKAPHFEFRTDCQFQEDDEFMEEAHHMVFSFSDSAIPHFYDYLTEHKIQFAKEWCEKEGYEWYEE